VSQGISLEERLAREREHGRVILDTDESNWGWHGFAGKVRRARRATFLCDPRGLPPRPRVLEVGCGTGTFTADLARAFAGLVAIDIAPVLLDAARGRIPGVDFRCADVHATGFPAGSFDLVVGCSVLHHLDWELALREVHRLLAPGGRIRFSEPNLQNPQIFLQKRWPWLKQRMGDSPDEDAFTPREALRSLTRAGFVDASAVPYEFLHPSTPRRLVDAVLAVESLVERTPLRAIAGSIRITARRA
jgi:SAM-dependent methyltransferase